MIFWKVRESADAFDVGVVWAKDISVAAVKLSQSARRKFV